MVDEYMKDPFAYGIWKAAEAQRQIMEEIERKKKMAEAMEAVRRGTMHGYDAESDTFKTKFWFDEAANFSFTSSAKEETAHEKSERQAAWADAMEWIRKAEELHKESEWKFRDHTFKYQQYQSYEDKQRRPGAQYTGATQEDCFKILGLAQPCTVDDIKRAFKKLALKAHPDVGGSKEAFQKINTAKQEALRRIS